VRPGEAFVKHKSVVWLLVVAACSSEYSDDSANPTPVANDDHIMLAEDQSLKLTALMGNDTDVGHVEAVDKPLHGTVSNGEYIPEPGYFGADKFTYEGRYQQYGGSGSRATAYILIASDGVGYERSSLLASTDANDLAIGDLDGDGKIDLVTCDTSRNEMTIFRNTTAAEGQYAVEEHPFEGGTSPVGVAIADLDGDGRLDIVTAASNGLTIFRNQTQPQGPLAFAGPVMIGTMVTSGLAVADLDGDGRPDLAAIQQRSWTDGYMHVWLNQSTSGSLGFGTQTTFVTPQNPTQIVAVDADGNNRADLAVLADEKLALFVNATSVSATVPVFDPRIDRGTAPQPRTMFLADLDGDGQNEIGVLHDAGAMWIYANQGTQTPSFEAARVIDLPTGTKIVQPAEIDGDGITDLVGAAGGTTPFSFLANRSEPQSFMFDVAEAKIADVDTLKRAAFATPTGLVFVDLDGVPPLEIVVASDSGSFSSDGDAGLRVLFGR